jgi:UDP-N-acetylmuramoyl-L-alanyl-D-glutamate--2,6-diaminopimelate ligase
MLPKKFPVACHTDNVGEGTTFVAIKGMACDGTDYIPVAIQKGAIKIVLSSDVQLDSKLIALCKERLVELARVKDTRLALAQLSSQALNYPARKLKIIGITGTKGKSTTTFLLEHILRTAGKKTAMLSTVFNRINGVDVPTKLTTQQPDYLHVFFDECVRQDVEYVVMEVAAQAFSLQRVFGLEFNAAIFTNFSQEHGEFYPNMDDYFAAKSQIITHLKEDALLFLNSNDQTVVKLAQACKKHILFTQEHQYVCPALMGDFNNYNISAATGVARSLGLSSQVIQKTLDGFAGVPGRMEKYTLSNGALGVVDYAHNPSSYKAVLGELRKLTDHLIVVFGCGGERDPARRPIMGDIASEFADIVVLTSDNPRSENPQVIIDDIISGVVSDNKNKIIQELDREQAIKKAYSLSRKNSFLIVLGKGPDAYQIIGTTTYPFSDVAIVKSL